MMTPRSSSLLLFLITFVVLRLETARVSAQLSHGSSKVESKKAVASSTNAAAGPILQSVDLAFENITAVLDNGARKTKGKKNGSSGKTKIILDGSIRGRARPGRMLAIMGPSGAGKSTILHALAGRIKGDTSKLKLYGRRYLNGQEVAGDSFIPAAFIEQEVNFFPHMTVRETLEFRVHLKVGSQLDQYGRNEMVDDLMEQVGLSSVSHSLVGNAKVRGISGGERKRLSIAVEMIESPSSPSSSLVFLDEPTSGLDTTAATKLVKTFRHLANAGRTIVAVIHQPSQHVFEKFDDILLVSEGKQMYFGERKGVRAYMANLECNAPAEMGTAEHILDCISRHTIADNETEADIDARMVRIAAKASSEFIDMGIKDMDDEAPKMNGRNGKKAVQHFLAFGTHDGRPQASVVTQFRLLLQRSFREIFRGKFVLVIKAIKQVSVALIYGGIYSVGTNQASIQDRVGLLSLIAVSVSNTALVALIRAFPREKSIVSNELASRMYRTLPYFVGKALSGLPVQVALNTIFGTMTYHLTGLSGNFARFLSLLVTHSLVAESMGLLIGALAPNSDFALAMFPLVMVVSFIFDGRNISEESIPPLLRWVTKLGVVRWGYQGLCLNEFERLEFETNGPRRGPIAWTGSEALALFGLGTQTLREVFRAQLLQTGSFWVLSYLGLSFTRQRYLAMKDPQDRMMDLH